MNITRETTLPLPEPNEIGLLPMESELVSRVRAYDRIDSAINDIFAATNELADGRNAQAVAAVYDAIMTVVDIVDWWRSGGES